MYQMHKNIEISYTITITFSFVCLQGCKHATVRVKFRRPVNTKQSDLLEYLPAVQAINQINS